MTPTRGERWSRAHAVVMLGAMVVTLGLDESRAFALLATASFSGLAYLYRGRFTPGGAFGVANLVTLLRLLLVLGLSVIGLNLEGPVAAALVVFVFALDGLDGWLARRMGTASSFGARFDMETDAFLFAVTSVLLVQRGQLDASVLLAGALHYLYALALPLLPARGREPPPSRLGRHVFSVMLLSLSASLWPLPFHQWLSRIALALLVYSFARSVVWALRPV